jgi:hypothetical protein
MDEQTKKQLTTEKNKQYMKNWRDKNKEKYNQYMAKYMSQYMKNASILKKKEIEENKMEYKKQLTTEKQKQNQYNKNWRDKNKEKYNQYMLGYMNSADSKIACQKRYIWKKERMVYLNILL